VPLTTSKAYAPHHIEFWEWVDTIKAGANARPYACIWPRGHAKSTGVEVAAVKWGCLGVRSYGLYVSGTQELADKHIESIAEVLESPEIERYYPRMARRKVGKYGNSRGWRRNRVMTSTGWTVDALGLDVAPRGLKVAAQRPDFIILDDIDDAEDKVETVDKKLRRITQAVLPAGSDDGFIVAMAQNLTHRDSIVARMIDGRTDLLSEAHISGPFPAVESLEYETEPTDTGRAKYVVTGGQPTWAGMDLAACQHRINTYGLHAFTIESQQQIAERRGALWTRALVAEHRVSTYPELLTIGVGVDPNKTGKADDAGVIVAGVGIVDGMRHAFILDDATQTTRPELWRDEAAEMYLQWQAGMFVVERTGLGEHASLTLRDAPALRDMPVTIEPVDAKISKEDRARPVAQLYRDGRVHHVGVHPVVEGQMTSWVPGRGKSPGGIDALVHLVTRLLIDDVMTDAWAPDADWMGGMGTMSW